MERARWLTLLVVTTAVVGAAWLLTRPRPPAALVEPEPASAPTPDDAPGPALAGRAPPAPVARAIRGTVYRAGSRVSATIGVIAPAAPGERPDVYRPPQPGSTVSATADDGFAVPAPTAGRYGLQCEGITTWIDVHAQDRTRHVVIVLPDGPHQVRVRVVSEDGRPIRLPVTAGGSAVSTTKGTTVVGLYRPDEDGRFVINRLEPGTLRLAVQVEPGAKFSQSFVVPRDGDIEWVVADPSWTLNVRTFDMMTRAPVHLERFVLTVKRSDDTQWRVDGGVQSGDRFTCRIPDGDNKLLMWAKGYAIRILEPDAGTPNLDVGMAPVAVISGKVVHHESGEPVAGVPVTVHEFDDGDVEGILLFGPRPKSAKDGTFTFQHDKPLSGAMVFAIGNGWVSKGLAQIGQAGVNPFVISDVYREGRDRVLAVEPAGSLDVRVVNTTGEPVAGCQVIARQPHWSLGRFSSFGARDLTPRAVSDKRGRISFRDLVPGWTYDLWTSRYSSWRRTGEGGGRFRVVSGPNPARTLTVARRGDAPTRTRAKPEAHAARTEPLVVSVVDSEGRPVRGASLAPFLPDGQPLRYATGVRTNAEGQARLVGLHGGPLQIEVRRRGFQKTRAPVDARAAAVRVELTPHAAGAGRPRHRTTTRSRARPVDSHRLVVRSPDGVPVEAFTGLHLTRERSGKQGSSMYATFDGAYRLWQVSERTWIDIVRAAPGTSGRLPLGALRLGPFEAGALPTNLQVTLPPERAIEGRVVDTKGRGLAGVKIEAFAAPPDGVTRARLAWSHEETFTRADGSFRIGRLGDLLYDLRIFAPAPVQGRLFLDVPVGARGRDFVLHEGVAVRVRVLDDTGTAIEGSLVAAVNTDGVTYRGLDDPLLTGHANTDADGWATLPLLDPSRTYTLTVSPPTEAQRPRTIDNWTPRETTVALDAGGVLSGVVRDTNGQLVEGAAVRLLGPEGPDPMISTGTDADGRFRLDQLPLGPVQVGVRAPGTGRDVTRDVTVPAGGVELRVDLGGSIELALRTWPEGVRWYRYRAVELESDGRVRHEWRGSGTRKKPVILRGLDRAARQAIHVTTRIGVEDPVLLVAYVPRVAPDASRVVLELVRAESVRVRVIAPPEVLAQRPELRIDDGALRLRGIADAHGRASWGSLPEGRYRVVGTVTIGTTKWAGEVIAETGRAEAAPEARLVLRSVPDHGR